MTTPIPELWQIAEIQDRAALQLVQRIIQAEVVLLESRMTQLKELDAAVNERLQGMK